MLRRSRGLLRWRRLLLNEIGSSRNEAPAWKQAGAFNWGSAPQPGRQRSVLRNGSPLCVRIERIARRRALNFVRFCRRYGDFDLPFLLCL